MIHVSAGLREAKSWDDVHKTFADIGLRVEKAQGKKGYVITHEHQNQKTAVKASLVFNKAQYTLKSMEERFGEYQPSHIEPAKVSVFKTAYTPGAYRRDANKRLQRKIERAEERMLLKVAIAPTGTIYRYILRIRIASPMNTGKLPNIPGW